MCRISRLRSTATVMVVLGALLGCPPDVRGQDPADRPAARNAGLPLKIEWRFNFEAGFGTFGFLNSLYTNPRDEPSGDLGDNWFEGFVKPALSGTRVFGGGFVYGKLSAVGRF
jgi:hypothetical protein